MFMFSGFSNEREGVDIIRRNRHNYSKESILKHLLGGSLKEIQHFGKCAFSLSLKGMRREDQYHSHICLLNMKLQLGDHYLSLA